MDWAGLIYLGVTFGLCVLLAVIVIRTYSKKREKKLEEPKRRMLDDD